MVLRSIVTPQIHYRTNNYTVLGAGLRLMIGANRNLLFKGSKRWFAHPRINRKGHKTEFNTNWCSVSRNSHRSLSCCISALRTP